MRPCSPIDAAGVSGPFWPATEIAKCFAGRFEIGNRSSRGRPVRKVSATLIWHVAGDRQSSGRNRPSYTDETTVITSRIRATRTPSIFSAP